ncbi:MAG: SDR family oxidoreductase [Gemmatimonadota bacterium]
MTAELGEETRSELADRIPLGRIGDARDIAGVVRFLAGPASAYMTGQVLVVDGGMVMHG